MTITALPKQDHHSLVNNTSQDEIHCSNKLVLPKHYQTLNKPILDRIKKDIEANKNFHYLFIGKPGSGKTYLSKIIMRNLHWNKMYEARKLYKEYLRCVSLSSSVPDRSAAIERTKKVFCKDNEVLDDLGTEQISDSSAQYFAELLTTRYDLIMAKKVSHSIITTNLSGKDISKVYGDRVLDRLYETFTVFLFADHSFREQKVEVIKGGV